jgi:hypothetical protein
MMPQRLQTLPKKILPEHVHVVNKHLIPNLGAHLLFAGPTLEFELLMKVLYNGIGSKKLPDKFVRWTTDAELIDVSVGQRSLKRNPNSTIATYEGLLDYINTPDVLIIELGKQLTPNKTGAQALEETLQYRIDNRIPVWILRSANAPWMKGSVSWSESNQALVDRFDAINIVRELESYAPDLEVEGVVFRKDERLTSIDRKLQMGSSRPGFEPQGNVKEMLAGKVDKDKVPLTPTEFASGFKKSFKPQKQESTGLDNYGKGVPQNKLRG